MKAIILAASRGEQLGELTEEIPKCMLPFGQKSILERQIHLLTEIGIKRSDICVVAGYKPEKIKSVKGISVILNEEYKVTDNSYSLWLALQDSYDDVLVLDGDLVYEIEALNLILKADGNAVLVTDNNQYNGSTGIIVGENERLLAIGKHLLGEKSYASILKLTAETSAVLAKQLKNSKTFWYTVSLNKILDTEVFRVCDAKCRIIGINTYSDYLEAKKYFGIEKDIIWVTGATGFLGQKISNILKRNYTVVGTKGKSASSEFVAIDLVNKEAILAYARLIKPSIIVHTAGIPEPERCEADRTAAYQINVAAVENLVEVCNELEIKLIHISTDYVFDGNSNEEYKRNDERRPKNYYGVTKSQAEDVVKKCKNSLIIRVPLLYGYNHKEDKITFPIKILHKLGSGEEIYLDNKQIRYPVLIDDVAFAVKDSLQKNGIVHVTSGEPVTKYTWAKILAAEFGYRECLIKEDVESSLDDRPQHVKLCVEEQDYLVTDAKRGAEILRKQLACVFQLIYKSSPAEHVYGVNIGSYRYQLGKKLASVLPEDIVKKVDYIVPIPNSGLYYAMGLAEELKVPYLQALIKPDTLTRSFQIADIALREQVIRQKIMPVRELLESKNIILVDEAIFTGTTLRIVCDMVKACGAGEIYVALPTPICRNVCGQYVQPERRLLSWDVNEKELVSYFKVNGVFFQRYSVFYNSIRDLGDICQDCFMSGKNNTVKED
nr:sugar nucleotide-binding protein [uncultured Schaedlerella sp.]